MVKVSGKALSTWSLALLVAAFIVAVDNRLFFAGLLDELPLGTVDGLAYLALIVSLMTGALLALSLVLGTGPLLRPILALLLVVSATLGYFGNELGVVFDQEMVRNLAETLRDGNSQETVELLSWPLAGQVLLFGLLPAIVVFRLPVRQRPLARELGGRSAWIAGWLALSAVLLLANYRFVTYFSVEHRDLRYYAMPIFALISFEKYLERRLDSPDDAVFEVLAADARRDPLPRSRPLVGVMVVGETARADHFSLGRYERRTNPLLAGEDGLRYFEIDACGTSTAYSVPCMFSLGDHDAYSPEIARHRTNVLDVLSSVGVDTVWIDNNSSCKGVCNRIESINLHADVDASSPWYQGGSYIDGVLLDELDRRLDQTDGDALIILHMLGSHGPAYNRRYPSEFDVFQPSCRHESPKECSVAEIVNAYDNTILYTDYILDGVIGRLSTHREFETFMLYASDHGESLGENGVYLHGLPRALAPHSQTVVPLVVWTSPSLRPAAGDLRDTAGRALSHDDLSHTLLGLYDVSTVAYDPANDMFAGTRQARHARLGGRAVTAGGAR